MTNIADITVPNWGLDMEEATVVEWCKQVDDAIKSGDIVLLLETDKAEGEVEAEQDGTLVEILVQPGEIVKPGQVLGRMQTLKAQ